MEQEKNSKEFTYNAMKRELAAGQRTKHTAVGIQPYFPYFHNWKSLNVWQVKLPLIAQNNSVRE